MSREFITQSGLVSSVPDGRDFILPGTFLAGEPVPPAPLVLVSPTNMTSNTSPAPYVVTSSNELAGYLGFNAFDSSEASLAHSNDSLVAIPYWIKIDLGAPQYVARYKYQARNVGPYHCWKSWILEGSNDNAAWTLVDTVVGEPDFAISEIRWYDCDAPNTFRYWSWSVTQTGGISGTYAEAATLELWGYLEEVVILGRAKVWSGTAWGLMPVKVWTGSAWVEKPLKVWNGSAWV